MIVALFLLFFVSSGYSASIPTNAVFIAKGQYRYTAELPSNISVGASIPDGFQNFSVSFESGCYNTTEGFVQITYPDSSEVLTVYCVYTWGFYVVTNQTVFNWTLYSTADTDDCYPRPCQHCGNGTDLLRDYTCACPVGFPREKLLNKYRRLCAFTV
uniref:uncharacterized protein LOC108949634 n=1 Tax=Ciona intestinalis TaxID=7719 RepID=UPI00089DCFF3|nr:uncharacterized protein LOC108949634 [Ciona intestinalis]|eukprot:XP_018668180.1 uncharacterized protein LOC108949634 [Ciona intestinalis]